MKAFTPGPRVFLLIVRPAGKICVSKEGVWFESKPCQMAPTGRGEAVCGMPEVPASADAYQSQVAGKPRA